MPLSTTNETDFAQFAEMLEDYVRVVPERGSIIKGEVLRIEDDAILLDIGAKRDAFVAARELDAMDGDLGDAVSAGDTLPIMIERMMPGGSLIEGSLEKGLAAHDWQEAIELMKKDEVIDVRITHYNKGGVLANFRRISGFIPNSHLPSTMQGHNLQSAKAKLTSAMMTVKFLEVDQDQNRLLLSAKLAEKEQQEEMLMSLTLGQRVRGKVVNTKPYGAFIDIGHGLTGLAHISKLSYQHITHASDAVALGDEIDVVIDNINLDKMRISLDHKATLKNPLETLAEEFDPNEPVEGIITSVTEYGAFIKVYGDYDGLLHVSQMPRWMADDHQETLRNGDKLLVAIQSVDPVQGRIGLTHHALADNTIADWVEKPEQGAVAA